jgi:hypothetical protein
MLQRLTQKEKGTKCFKADANRNICIAAAKRVLPSHFAQTNMSPFKNCHLFSATGEEAV